MKNFRSTFVRFIALSLFCFLGYIPPGAAQTSECYTDGSASPHAPVSLVVSLPCAPSTDPASDFGRFYGHPENYMPVNGDIGPLYVHKTIKVLFHVMQPSSSGGPKVNYEDNPTDRATIQGILDKMNDWLTNVPVPAAPKTAVCGACHVWDSRFRVEMAKRPDGSPDIRFHPDGIAWENIYSGGSAGPGTYNGSLNGYFENPDGVLNIFLMYSSHPYGPLAGLAPGFSRALGDLIGGVNNAIPFIVTANYYGTTTDVKLTANNLLHEIGHTMGTHHTFDAVGGELCTETDWDYLSDIFGTTASGTKFCPLTTGAGDVFMNYNMHGNYLSPLQIARWHRDAHFLSCRKYIYNTYPEDKNHDNTGQGQYYTLNITRNETWDFDIKMYTDIVVKSGNKLSIRCRVLMPYHSNIIVEPGAELEIDGGIITSHHDTTMWYGISVWGDASKSQYNISDHGLLTMKNDATISNAVRAVTVGDAISYSGAHNGGIVHIDDAHFINNRGGLLWLDYHNLWWEYKGGTWSRTWLRPNAGYIARTDFTINDKQIRDPRGQISMANVDGIGILGCRFVCTMPYTPTATRCLSGCPDNEAIATWNATFTVDKWETASGAVTPSYFSGFRHGVYAQSFAVSNNFTVRNSTFENNLIGVGTRSVNQFTIRDNNFLINNPINSGVAALGIQLNSSSLYRVYDNSFGRPGSGVLSQSIGVEVSRGGSDFNRVNNNSYTSLKTGNLSSYQNTNGFYDPLDPSETKSRGLEFTCNTHTSVGTDIYIQGYKSATGAFTDGIRRIQGSSDVPSGNTFSTFGGLSRPNIYALQIGPGFTTYPLDKYYFYTGDPLQEPAVSPNVYKQPTGDPNLCILSTPGSGPVTGTGTGAGSSSIMAAGARERLAEAYDDYSPGRFARLDTALLAMESPYAEVERSLLYMQEGQVQQGLGIYNAVFSGQAQMPLTAEEHHDFVIGATLMRLVAERYTRSSTPRWDSLSSTEADSLRYVRDSARMWAHQRACAWLGFALQESCAALIPELPEPPANTMRRAVEAIQEGGERHLRIQPNPSGSHFDVRYTAEADMALSVHDVLGREVYRASLPASSCSPGKGSTCTHRIPAMAWANGVYLYRVSAGDKTLYHGKLIKQ